MQVNQPTVMFACLCLVALLLHLFWLSALDPQRVEEQPLELSNPDSLEYVDRRVEWADCRGSACNECWYWAGHSTGGGDGHYFQNVVLASISPHRTEGEKKGRLGEGVVVNLRKLEGIL